MELLQNILRWRADNCRVYAVAQYDDQALFNPVLELGVEAVITKPLDRNALIQSLAKYVHTPQIEKLKEEFSGTFIVKELGKIEAFADYTPLPQIDSFMQSFAALADRFHSLILRTNNRDQRASFYSDRLLDIEEEFTSYVNTQAKQTNREGELNLQQSVGLFGISRTRDFLFARTLIDHFEPGKALFTETNAMNFFLNDYVGYAVKAEDHFGFDSRYAEVAYFSGLLFDYLKVLNRLENHNSEEVSLAIETQFIEGIEHCERAFFIGKQGENLVLEHLAVPVCMLKNWGKLYYMIRHKKFAMVMQQFRSQNIPMTFQRIWEEHALKAPSILYAALACSLTPYITNAFRPLLFWDCPFFLNHDEHDCTQLAKVTEKAHRLRLTPDATKEVDLDSGDQGKNNQGQSDETVAKDSDGVTAKPKSDPEKS